MPMRQKRRSKTEPLEAGLEQNLALGGGWDLLLGRFQLGDVGEGRWHQAPLSRLQLWCLESSVRVLTEMPSWSPLQGVRDAGHVAPGSTRRAAADLARRPVLPRTTRNAGCFHCASSFARKNRAPLSPRTSESRSLKRRALLHTAMLLLLRLCGIFFFSCGYVFYCLIML